MKKIITIQYDLNIVSKKNVHVDSMLTLSKKLASAWKEQDFYSSAAEVQRCQLRGQNNVAEAGQKEKCPGQVQDVNPAGPARPWVGLALLRSTYC